MNDSAELQYDSPYIADILENSMTCVKRMGLKVLDIAPRRVKMFMPLAGNENHIGTMYAGPLFTVAELPGGAIFFSTFDVLKYYPFLKRMEIEFKKTAATDVTITVQMSQEEVDRINGELEEKGKSEFILNGEIKDTNGIVVAESKGYYLIRKQ